MSEAHATSKRIDQFRMRLMKSLRNFSDLDDLALVEHMDDLAFLLQEVLDLIPAKPSESQTEE